MIKFIFLFCYFHAVAWSSFNLEKFLNNPSQSEWMNFSDFLKEKEKINFYFTPIDGVLKVMEYFLKHSSDEIVDQSLPKWRSFLKHFFRFRASYQEVVSGEINNTQLLTSVLSFYHELLIRSESRGERAFSKKGEWLNVLEECSKIVQALDFLIDANHIELQEQVIHFFKKWMPVGLKELETGRDWIRFLRIYVRLRVKPTEEEASLLVKVLHSGNVIKKEGTFFPFFSFQTGPSSELAEIFFLCARLGFPDQKMNWLSFWEERLQVMASGNGIHQGQVKFEGWGVLSLSTLSYVWNGFALRGETLPAPMLKLLSDLTFPLLKNEAPEKKTAHRLWVSFQFYEQEVLKMSLLKHAEKVLKSEKTKVSELQRKYLHWLSAWQEKEGLEASGEIEGHIELEPWSEVLGKRSDIRVSLRDGTLVDLEIDGPSHFWRGTFDLMPAARFQTALMRKFEPKASSVAQRRFLRFSYWMDRQAFDQSMREVFPKSSVVAQEKFFPGRRDWTAPEQLPQALEEVLGGNLVLLKPLKRAIHEHLTKKEPSKEVFLVTYGLGLSYFFGFDALSQDLQEAKKYFDSLSQAPKKLNLWGGASYFLAKIFFESSLGDFKEVKRLSLEQTSMTSLKKQKKPKKMEEKHGKIYQNFVHHQQLVSYYLKEAQKRNYSPAFLFYHQLILIDYLKRAEKVLNTAQQESLQENSLLESIKDLKNIHDEKEQKYFQAMKVNALVLLGKHYLHKGEIKKALPYLEKAIQGGAEEVLELFLNASQEMDRELTYSDKKFLVSIYQHFLESKSFKGLCEVFLKDNPEKWLEDLEKCLALLINQLQVVHPLWPREEICLQVVNIRVTMGFMCVFLAQQEALKKKVWQEKAIAYWTQATAFMHVHFQEECENFIHAMYFGEMFFNLAILLEQYQPSKLVPIEDAYQLAIQAGYFPAYKARSQFLIKNAKASPDPRFKADSLVLALKVLEEGALQGSVEAASWLLEIHEQRFDFPWDVMKGHKNKRNPDPPLAKQWLLAAQTFEAAGSEPNQELSRLGNEKNVLDMQHLLKRYEFLNIRLDVVASQSKTDQELLSKLQRIAGTLSQQLDQLRYYEELYQSFICSIMSSFLENSSRAVPCFQGVDGIKLRDFEEVCERFRRGQQNWCSLGEVLGSRTGTAPMIPQESAEVGPDAVSYPPLLPEGKEKGPEDEVD